MGMEEVMTNKSNLPPQGVFPTTHRKAGCSTAAFLFFFFNLFVVLPFMVLTGAWPLGFVFIASVVWVFCSKGDQMTPKEIAKDDAMKAFWAAQLQPSLEASRRRAEQERRMRIDEMVTAIREAQRQP